jgi:hypothetical protein
MVVQEERRDEKSAVRDSGEVRKKKEKQEWMSDSPSILGLMIDHKLLLSRS